MSVTLIMTANVMKTKMTINDKRLTRRVVRLKNVLPFILHLLLFFGLPFAAIASPGTCVKHNNPQEQDCNDRANLFHAIPPCFRLTRQTLDQLAASVFAGHIAYALWGFDGVWEIFFLDPERQVNKIYEHRYLDEGSDDGGERLSGTDAENGYGHRYSELEIIRRSGEGKSGRLPVMCLRLCAHVKRDDKHEHEIDQKRYGDPHDIHGNFHNVFALEREHDKDGKEKSYKGDRADLRDEPFMIPGLVFNFYQNKARDHPRNEGDAEINENTLRDLAYRNIYHNPFQTEHGRQYRDKYVSIDGEEQNLEYRIEGNKSRAVFGVSLREVVPNDDHRYTPGKPDHDKTHHVFRIAPQEYDREKKHQNRPDNPVLDQGQDQYPVILKDFPQLFIPHFRERRIHHKYKAYGNRNICRTALELVPEIDNAGGQITPANSDKHGEKDP